MKYFKKDLVVGFKFRFRGSIKTIKNIAEISKGEYRIDCVNHRFSFSFLLAYLNAHPEEVLTPKTESYELY